MDSGFDIGLFPDQVQGNIGVLVGDGDHCHIQGHVHQMMRYDEIAQPKAGLEQTGLHVAGLPHNVYLCPELLEQFFMKDGGMGVTFPVIGNGGLPREFLNGNPLQTRQGMTLGYRDA